MRYSQRQALAVEAAERVTGHGDWRRTWCGVCVENGMDEDGTAWALHLPTGFYFCHSCNDKGRLPGHEDEGEFDDGPETTPVNPLELQAPEDFELLTAPNEYLAKARRYLVGRGISRQIAAEAKLGACLEGPYRGRIIVPILPPDGSPEWLGFAGRLFRPAKTYKFEGREYTEPRYKYPPGPWRGDVLWNIGALFADTEDPCYGMEGTFSALPYWPDAFAFLGKPLPGQYKFLLRSTRPLVICLDGDAWKQGRNLTRQLEKDGRKKVGYLILPPGEDPNSIADRGRLREAGYHAIANGFCDLRD